MSIASLILLLLVGCQPTIQPPSPTPTPVMSPWGRVWTIAQTPQSDAPAFAVSDQQITFAWVGSDAVGVHHDVRLFDGRNWSESAALPLSPMRPDAFQTFAAAYQRTHLLYLDADPATNQTRLYSAVFKPDLTLELGPTLISPQQVYHYSAISLPDNSVWVVWSSGLLSEPRLYARYIDSTGRPRPPIEIAAHGDYPTLLQGANGELWVFWLRDKTIYRAQMDSATGALTDTLPLTTHIPLQTGERLVNISAGADTTYGYLFWNTVTTDGTPQTWVASGVMTAESWDAPRLLGVDVVGKRDFQTGYNGGVAHSAQAGETPVTWVAPIPQSSGYALAATAIGDALGVLYVQTGEIVAFQPIITLDYPLIGLPALITDPERHVYLAWSSPVSLDAADLLFTTTRPIQN